MNRAQTQEGMMTASTKPGRRAFLTRLIGLAAIVAIGASVAGTTLAQAATGPLYDVRTIWAPTNLPPGGEGLVEVQARNIGDAVGSESLTFTDQLPAGVTVTDLHWVIGTKEFASRCSGVGTETVTCVVSSAELASLFPAPGSRAGGITAALPIGYGPVLRIGVSVSPGASGAGVNTTTMAGGSGPAANDIDSIPFGPTPPGFGLIPGSFEADVFDQAYPFGGPSRVAGDHPFEQRVNFNFNGKVQPSLNGTFINSSEIVKTVEATLPRGMLGNPEATPKCEQADFAQRGSLAVSTGCPADTQVGYLNVWTAPGIEPGSLSRVPIYNLVPPRGVPADFGFNAFVVQAHIYPELDPSQNYAIKTVTPNISSLESVLGSEVTFWGVPGDSSHDKFRAYPAKAEGNALGAPWGSAPVRPLLTDPMDCGYENGAARIRADSYNHPGAFTPIEEGDDPLNVSGCNDPRIRFEPDIALQPTDAHAGAPTGLSVHLEVPQQNDEATQASQLYAKNGHVKGIGTPPMKKAVVTFPEGMTLSPSAAQGLGSCTPEQIGLGTNAPVRCPDSSQYGTLTLHTPILPQDNPPKGFIYIAEQNDNPFHNFLSIYLAIEEPERGILVKIPGKLDLDPRTGQITTTFDDLPQFPVTDMEMSFKGGVRAGLVEPSTCGTKRIRAEFFSWAAPGVPAVVNSSYEITQKPDGSPCPSSLANRQFKPAIEAGTLNPIAGSYSPFLFHLTRSDDDQELSQLEVTLPQGLAARFTGVAMCSNAAIAAAEARTGAGQGSLEQAQPSCPPNSQIGTTEVGTGVGVPLTYVPGRVYLAGPYKGAPMSIVVISPAVVGPFDLGVIAVRSALRVDRVTAQGTAISDPLPQIFQGIPVRIRDIRLKLDRPDFTLNPTSCASKQIEARVTGTGGEVSSAADDTSVSLQSRFQAAECRALGFAPKLSFRLFGGTRRGAHPKLKATLRARPGDANIARAAVALPASEFLDQGHIGTVCTRVQFAQHACPAASVYGHAVARTPLFEQPLEGPVYLRSSSNQLPDLVAALRGPDSQPVEVDLDGRIDSVNGGIRNTFELVPDAPVSSFTLTMQGGRRGLLVNSVNLCAKPNRVTAKFNAQNGKASTIHPLMQNGCNAAAKKARQKRRGG